MVAHPRPAIPCPLQAPTAWDTEQAPRTAPHASRITYHVWTIGCQMNRADSRRAAAELERLGYRQVPRPEEADLVILNTCVVRQSAEDKAVGRLGSLRALKRHRPGAALVVMGCLVGDPEELRARFPYVDLFLRPSDVDGLVAWVQAHPSPLGVEGAPTPSPLGGEGRVRGGAATEQPLVPPATPTRLEPEPPSPHPSPSEGEGAPTPSPSGRAGAPRPSPLVGEGRVRGGATPTGVSAELPATMGCDRHCTYCIVRLRRGPARSRPIDQVVDEAAQLVRAGAREIVLLGQNIDAYGGDLPGRPGLAELLRRVHEIPGLLRLRFLTSHPADLDDKVIEAVAGLPRVCPHFELPVQAGDDEVLRRMGRGHTTGDYLALVGRIRARLPQASIATDVIVGFPGETAEQFERTLDLLRTARFDAVHVACYSPRPGTPAARLADDVPPAEKERRRRAVEELQERIAGEINAQLLGHDVEVLVEEKHRGKWKGRTATNKLVFFPHPADWTGRLATVRITWAGPWSLQGELRQETP